MNKVIILGTGGNCVDILDTINSINSVSDRMVYECIGFLDDDETNWGVSHHGIEVLGPLKSAKKYHDVNFINGIGSANNFFSKEHIISTTGLSIDCFITLIHPSASVSSMAKLGKGVVIFQNVTITSNVSVGNHVIILPNSIISHDSSIGDYTCVTGGVCISGGVSIGVSCYLGTNSCIKGNVNIGDYCLIGMGSVVLDSVEINSVVVGNPASFLKETRQLL